MALLWWVLWECQWGWLDACISSGTAGHLHQSKATSPIQPGRQGGSSMRVGDNLRLCLPRTPIYSRGSLLQESRAPILGGLQATLKAPKGAVRSASLFSLIQSVIFISNGRFLKRQIGQHSENSVPKSEGPWPVPCGKTSHTRLAPGWGGRSPRFWGRPEALID